MNTTTIRRSCAGRFNRTSLSEQVGGNPSPDHPMQYVSSQVALYFAGVCGCRLPAPAEWHAAYDAFEKNVSIERLESPRSDLGLAATPTRPRAANNRWPDEGIFPAVAGPSFTGRNATSRPEKDGALFFQPVNGSGAVIFRHLVGNVAQFTCDKPESFDDWTDKKTAAGIRKFIEQAPKSLFVIGGSALSPPQAPFDKPLAVEHTDEAYADVGFRLAFTAPSRNAGRKGEMGDRRSPVHLAAKAGGDANLEIGMTKSKCKLQATARERPIRLTGEFARRGCWPAAKELVERRDAETPRRGEEREGGREGEKERRGDFFLICFTLRDSIIETSLLIQFLATLFSSLFSRCLGVSAFANSSSNRRSRACASDFVGSTPRTVFSAAHEVVRGEPGNLLEGGRPRPPFPRRRGGRGRPPSRKFPSSVRTLHESRLAIRPSAPAGFVRRP